MPPAITLPADNLDFAWDRPESTATLRAKLADESAPAWPASAAWLLREARVDQVWQFLTLSQIVAAFPRLAPLLGRRRPLWEYLLRTARELGRI